MREILFRGKCYDDGEWIFGSLLDDDIIVTKGAVEVDEDYIQIVDEWSSLIPETVGQYTGMADKNGTNIFEGDIVRESFKGHGRIYHVFWDDDYFAFRAKGEDITYHLDEISPSHCEVIGNIHDKHVL